MKRNNWKLHSMILCLFGLQCLSGCSQNTSISNLLANIRLTEEQKDARNTFNSLITYIENKDKESIKKLFAQNVVEEVGDLNQMIEQLIEFYQGNMESYNDWAGPMVTAEGGSGVRTLFEYECSFDITTSEKAYQLAFKETKEDVKHPKNEGINSLFIVSDAYIDKGFAYGVNGEWTPGIFFNKMVEEQVDEN